MKNKIIKKLTIISLLATASIIAISSVPNFSQHALAASKKNDTKISSSKTKDTKTNSSKTKDTKTNSSNSNTSSNSDDSDTSNPTAIPLKEYEQPDHYWAWLQWWGPWADSFSPTQKSVGGKGVKDWAGGNEGCVSTSVAIQAARAGVKMNPSQSPFPAAGPFTVDGHTISRNSTLTGGGAKGNMTWAQALEQCKKIASSGNYPIIRLSGEGQGNNPDVHTVAYWKAGNGKPLIYDPARNFTGDWARPPIGYVGYVKITGGKKFSEDSPGPGGEGSSNSNDSDSSKSNDSNSDSGSGSGSSESAKIKPIFNPFYSPAVHYIPADQQDNQDQTNAQVMQTADGMLPTVLGSLRVFVGFTAYVYAMLAIIAILVALADLQLGGILQEKVLAKSGPMTKALFMPGGNFMGVDDGRGTVVSGKNPAMTIIMNGTKHYAALLIILTLVASGSMSWIIGNSIALIGSLFGF